MTYDMTGKVALITGGSSGIGLATAHAFAAAGARVAIASRDPDRGRAAEAAVREAHAGAEVLWIQADVSQADQVQALVERAVGTLGGLDFAFNNGGSGGEGGWIVDIGDADFDATVGGYLKSVFLCLKAELKVMLNAGTPEEPAGSGVIVNNASVDGLRAFPWILSTPLPSTACWVSPSRWRCSMPTRVSGSTRSVRDGFARRPLSGYWSTIRRRSSAGSSTNPSVVSGGPRRSPTRWCGCARIGRRSWWGLRCRWMGDTQSCRCGLGS